MRIIKQYTAVRPAAGHVMKEQMHLVELKLLLAAVSCMVLKLSEFRLHDSLDLYHDQCTVTASDGCQQVNGRLDICPSRPGAGGGGGTQPC